MDLEHSERQTANRMNSVLLGLYVHTHLHICPTTGYQWPTASGRSPQNMHVIVCTHNTYVGHNMAERACTSGQLHDSPERPVNRPIETLYCFWSNYRRKVRKVRKKKTHSTNYLSKWRMLQMPRADMFWAKLSFFCCSVACLAQIEAIEMGHQSQLVVGSCEDVTRTQRLGGDMKRRYRSWIREVMKQWKLQPDDVIALWGHVFFILFKIITKNPST